MCGRPVLAIYQRFSFSIRPSPKTPLQLQPEALHRNSGFRNDGKCGILQTHNCIEAQPRSHGRSVLRSTNRNDPQSDLLQRLPYL